MRRTTLAAPASERAEEQVQQSPPPAGATRRPGREHRRRAALLVIAAAALAGGLWLAADNQSQPAVLDRPAVESSVPPVLDGAPVGHQPVRDEQVVLEPGASRQWEGVHQVTVSAGTLSVEDGNGYRREFGAGNTFSAGWTPYAAANRTPAPVRVTVTYLQPAANADQAPAPND